MRQVSNTRFMIVLLRSSGTRSVRQTVRSHSSPRLASHVNCDDAERLPLEADLVEAVCTNLRSQQFCSWKLADPIKQILVGRGVATGSKPSERWHAQRHVSEIGRMQRPPRYVGGFQHYQPCLLYTSPSP